MDPRIAELLQRLGEVDDVQLGDLEDILVEQLEVAASTKDVDVARNLAEAIDRVRQERSQREELALAREAEIAEIMSRVHAHESEPSRQPNGDGEGDKSGEGEGDKSGEGEGDGGDGNKEPATTNASLKDRPLPKITDLLKSRSTASATPSRSRGPERQTGTTTVVAASDVPGLTAGSEITDPISLRKAMVERWEATAGSRTSGRIPVAKMQMNYPEERVLRAGDEEGNADKIRRLTSPQGLVASGGICAPPAGFYETNTLGTAARPLRDSLAVFQATRGAISLIRSLSVSDVTGALGITTNADDIAGPTKPCLTIVCEPVVDVTVQAIHRCLQFGNFNARTHPEYVTHITDLTLSAHARMGEEALWAQMCSDSTAVTGGEELGAWRDLYGILSRAAIGMRSRHRMPIEATIRVVAPFWLATMLSNDLVRSQPGDNTVFGTQRAQFEAALRTINVAVTWTLEGSDGNPQVFGPETGGAINGYPDTVEVLVYPEGSFLFLDGGALDLGIVRDSTLNISNDFQTFAETFEAVAFLGPESLCLTADLCASGLAAGVNDTASCGS